MQIKTARMILQQQREASWDDSESYLGLHLGFTFIVLSIHVRVR